MTPFGRLGLAEFERRAHVLERDAVAGERERHELDAHRRQRGAAELHVADAFHLQQALLNDVRDGVVDLAGRARRRGERQDHHRRIGGIDLAIGRIRFQRRRQIRARGVDRRLHVARGAVDVAIQIELQRHVRAAERARRRHLVHVRDDAEAAFERRGDARRHGFGAGAGQDWR